MKKTVVIDVVGLSTALIGKHTLFLQSYISRHPITTIEPMLPAVTTAVQSTYLTGKWPTEHGIVGNGWYDRTDAEIKFWKQSNKLVEGEKIWDKMKKADPSSTTAFMFWWYNMYSSADYSVTPRPNYLADGRKLPDCYSHPASLRDELQSTFGKFPLFQFWGPGANIKSTQWIADATIYTDKKYNPTLTLVYLPHLDYCLQQYGPDFNHIHQQLNEIDNVVKQLVDHYEPTEANIILLSEYGITTVNQPIHINRILRNEGLLAIREERGLELLDSGASKAFAVADHQVAHIYLNDQKEKDKVKQIVENIKGVSLVLDQQTKKDYHIDHARSGDFVLVADNNSWFTYYYWLNDSRAPDFARSVDIHKKPGYDPVELFMTSKVRAAYKLLRKKAGFRYIMDVIPIDATLVKGSHGNISTPKDHQPIIISDFVEKEKSIPATAVYDVIWTALSR